MPQPAFERMIIIGRPSASGVPDTLAQLIPYLNQQKINYCVDAKTCLMLPEALQQDPAFSKHQVTLESLQPKNDVLVVLGGDGSMIHAARRTMHLNLPIIGINHGTLGFLADIAPHKIEALAAIMRGEYQIEERMLIASQLFNADGERLAEGDAIAVNDIVLTPGNVAQMISFSIAINQEPVCQQRADGLIITTPTGSTAYALSAGGPIIHPHMDAIALVPMLPHKLTSRPLVINSQSSIDITVNNSCKHSPAISADGGRSIRIQPGYRINIQAYTQKLQLLHPLEYQYFDTLRKKLDWEN